MIDYQIVKLVDKQALKERAAVWFHSKWGVPVEAYQESIADSLKEGAIVPSWYVCLDGDKIIAGAGVIENDFHDRKDLTPNLCALYTEEDYRGKGIAGKLLNDICEDMADKGVETLYLITDHTDFYERYGWEFHCIVQDDGESEMTRMYVHHQKRI